MKKDESARIQIRTQIFVVPVCEFSKKVIDEITKNRLAEQVEILRGPQGPKSQKKAVKVNYAEFESLVAKSKNPRRRLQFEVYRREGDTGPVFRTRQLQKVRNKKFAKKPARGFHPLAE